MGRLNAVPPPLDQNDPRFAWDASNHLAQSSNIASSIATPFISLSPSLVWCVQRMLRMDGEVSSKKFAIINGPLADAYTRLYRTGPILQRLKKEGMFNPAVKYKGMVDYPFVITNDLKILGSMEYLAWAEITKQAISEVIPCELLESLTETWPSCKKLLRLDILKNSSTIPIARQKFIDNPVHLDKKTGFAIGKICPFFGFSFQTDQAVITEIVYHLLQGWAVKIDVEDWVSQERACLAFVEQMQTSNKKEDGTIILATAVWGPKLRDAFHRGVQQAAQALLKEKSNRPNKTKRFNRRAIYDRT